MFHGPGDLILLCRPIMESRRIEISPIGPDQRVDFGVQHDLIEQTQVAERPVKLALENRPEINVAEYAVVEANLQGVGADDGEGLHFAKGVGVSHGVFIAVARSALAVVLVAASPSRRSILPGASRPRPPPAAAAAAGAIPKTIRPDPSRTPRPPLDSTRENAAGDAEQTARHTCG